MVDLDFNFTSEVWVFSATKASWHMLTVPVEMSADIKAFTKHLAKGFRSVRVSVKIGKSEWQTSLFPDSKSGCYFLPLKADIRKAENIKKGDSISVDITVTT